MILFFILAILQQTTIRAEAQPAQWYPELLAKFRLKSTEQSFCFESSSGVIQGDRIDAPVIPASVTKVYTTYVALKKFGPDFRFKTRFVLTPTPEGQILHISGDQDGYFQVAQIFYVLNELNRDGVSKLKRIVFDDSFYLDFELEPDAVQKRLTRIFNTSTWDQAMKSDYRDAVRRARALGLKMEENIPLMSAGSVSPGNSSLPSEHSFRTWNIPSLPLIHLLKDMNVHSTNRFAKAVFLKIRDPEGFNRTLREDLGASSLEMNFQDGSGGRAN